MTINVQFVYGAGPDGGWLGEGLRELRDKVIAEFGEDVNVPDIVDHRDDKELSKRVGAWEDPTVLIGHSCGVQTISEVAIKHDTKSIPYLMGIATSRFCKPVPLKENVLRATEIMANKNFFNPQQTQFLVCRSDDTATNIEVIESGEGHVESSQAEITHETALEEIRTAIINNPPPFIGV